MVPRDGSVEHPGTQAQLIPLGDGSAVHARAGVAEIRDPAGRLLVRYANGRAEIAVADGDLVLSAPRGRVVLDGAEGVELRARAERGSASFVVEPERVLLHTDRLELEAEHSRVTTGTATVLARQLSTTAVRLALHVEHYELEATRIVERARDLFWEVEGLAQSRVGQLRTLVRDIYSLRSTRTVMRSSDDTAIDGRRVLLG